MKALKVALWGFPISFLVCTSAWAVASGGVTPPGQATKRLSGDTVIASQGTAVLTLKEMDERLEEVPTDKRGQMMANPKHVEQMIMQLLLLEQVANDARAAGLDKSPLFVSKGDLADKRALTQLRNEQVAAFAIEKMDALTLAQEAYLNDPAAFDTPELVSIRQIYVRFDNTSEQTALRKIESAQTRLLAGEPFERVVAELSDDPNTKEQGGLLDRVRYEDLLPELRAAAAKIAEGQLTPIVRVSNGFYLARLEKKHPAVHRTFDEIKDMAIQNIRDREQKRAVREYQEKLMGNPLTANPEVVGTLADRYWQDSDKQSQASSGQ